MWMSYPDQSTVLENPSVKVIALKQVKLLDIGFTLIFITLVVLAYVTP